MEQKKMNLTISDGPDFFAHEVTVNFNPSQMILDFKCITPRADPRSQAGPVVSLKHNIVMLDLWHAKRFHELLGEVIKRYEKDYGKIEKPKAMQKAEKVAKKSKVQKDNPEEKTTQKATVPTYFG